MNYRVFWSPHAEGQFELIIRDAIDKSPIAEAAISMDRALASDPVGFGESRYDNVRVGFEKPLGVEFEVLTDVRTVIVFYVWRTDRK